MADANSALLQIDGLVTEFRLASGTIRANDDIRLTLRSGTTLGIVGALSPASPTRERLRRPQRA